jgi:hypothetical protein
MDHADEDLDDVDACTIISERIGSDRRELPCASMLPPIIGSLPRLKSPEAGKGVGGCGRKIVDSKHT